MHDKGYHKADGRFRQKRQASFCVELFSWVRRKHQRPSSITDANHFACSKLGDGFVVDALGAASRLITTLMSCALPSAVQSEIFRALSSGPCNRNG